MKSHRLMESCLIIRYGNNHSRVTAPKDTNEDTFSDMEIQKSEEPARDVVYWPGIAKEIVFCLKMFNL